MFIEGSIKSIFLENSINLVTLLGEIGFEDKQGS
jgi:hypothetical protein